MALTIEALEYPVKIQSAQPLSDADLLRFAAANEGLHFERQKTGELVIMTPTNNRTGMKGMYISASLWNWAEGEGTGYAFDSSTGFSLQDGSMLCPDASWIPRAKWEALTEEEKDSFSPICPSFVIELRSKTDTLSAVRAKMVDWMANGCELAWLIDPQRKAVEIYRQGRVPEVQEGHSSVYGDDPVPSFVLELGRVWA